MNKEKIKLIFNVLRKWIRESFSWILIYILIGIGIGLYTGKGIYQWRIKEAVKVGGMVVDGQVYDIKERIIIVK